MTIQLQPGTPELTLERDVPVRMADGVTLLADVYRPVAPGPHHVILISHPYDKTASESNFAYSHPSWYARQGYIVVAQDTRGRYRSEGTFYPFRHESEDVATTIEWASRLEGSSGKVATYGFSYPGLNQLLAAQRRPAGLASISPAFTGGRPYAEWFYVQGAFSLAFATWWANLLAMDTAARRADDETLAALAASLANTIDLTWVLPLRAHPALGLGDTPYYHDWLAHPTHDAYWRAFDADFGRIDVPGLHVGGWWDVFVRGTVNDYVSLAQEGRAPQKLVVGPWHHMPWRPLGGATDDAAATVIDDWQLRFWRATLDGEETGVLDHPVTVYVMGDGWRDLDAWPPSQSRAVDWFLHSDGRAPSKFGTGTLSLEAPGDEPPDVFSYDPAVMPAIAGGHSCCVEDIAPMGPADQDAIERTHLVLVYTSAPLHRDTDLIGDAHVTLHAATTAPDTDFSARLCIVDPAGTSTNLVEGIVRASYRESAQHPTPITPGEVYEYRIELGPLGARIPAGHRLRLQIGSADFPQWDRNLNTGGPFGQEPASAGRAAIQTVLHNGRYPSRVTLPVLH
ncbi:MAG: CocE/NonD family hydrolase [Gaiellales bacterium]